MGKLGAVMFALTMLVASIVSLYAYSEIIDAVIPNVCPSTNSFYLSDATTAGQLCCANDPSVHECDAAANLSSVEGQFGDTVYLFINSIVPVFGIIGVFASAFILIKSMQKHT